MSAAGPSSEFGGASPAGTRRSQRCRPTPTILQMEAVECGAAALAMILAHHGRWVPLEEVRQACGVNRDGSNAFNILKAARSYGLSAKAFRKEPDRLAELPVPSILHWNFNHYVVFEGVHKGRAFLNDPAGGRRSVSLDELDASFTGVVLAFQPSEAFRPGGTRPRPWRQLAGELRHSRASVVLIAVFSLFLVVPGIIVPGLSKLFVDKVLVQRFDHWLVPLCLALVGAGLVQMLVVHLQQKYLLRLEAKLSVVLASRLLARLLALPVPFFDQRQGGELANRVAAADRIGTLLSGQVATTLFNLFAVAAYGAAMAAFDPVLAALAAVIPLANLTLLAAMRRRMGDIGRRIATDQGRILGATASTIVGMETIKVMGGEDEAFAGWSGHQAKAMDGLQRLGLVSGLLAVAPELLTALGTAAVLGVGGLRVIDGALTVGALIAVQGVMVGFIGPFNGLVALADRIQAARGDLARLADVLNGGTEPRRDAPPAHGWPGKLEGNVEVRALSFGYSRTDPPLIEDFSLVLEPGMRVAIVGGSGSGKSTVGRLLCGLLAPWSGEVRIDGHRLEEIPAHLFAGSVAYVDQGVFLFEGTVRDNLTLWNPTVPEAAITQALKDAEIHADIAARPGRYDGAVAEGGTNFSGGQRQRLEVARALAGDPAVLVLDEATAALDPLTERRIDENLRRRGCACVIIAHRLSTIRDCDEIVVMRQGRIVERGTHDALLLAKGAYADLIGAGQ